MRYILGFGLILLGGVLTAVTDIVAFAIPLFIGVFLFASLPSEATFLDYRIANSDTSLVRKRYYMNFLPFSIISYCLTFGKALLTIVWKEEYFLANSEGENVSLTKVSRKEYVALRNEQRILYSTQVLSKEFMERAYSEKGIGFKRKKRRLIAAILFAALTLATAADPGMLFLTLIYEAVFVPMIILWIPAYKDAKIISLF